MANLGLLCTCVVYLTAADNSIAPKTRYNAPLTMLERGQCHGFRREHGDAGGNFKTPIKMTCAIHSSLEPEKPCYARHTATRYLSR